MKKLIKDKLALFLVLILFGCSSNNYDEKILGTWESSVYIDANKARTMFGADAGNGIEMEATFTTTEEYLRGGRYNSEGMVTLRMTSNGQEIPLKMMIKSSGSWEIHENYLVAINEDSKVTSMDETTRSILRNSPELASGFKPVKGESSSIEIVSIKGSTMQVKMENFPGLLITYQKK